jgi:hypothetical protein
MVRQGGAMVGREYRVAVDTQADQVEGKYEAFTKFKPVGVIDRVENKRAASDRKEWRPRGAWGSRVGGLAHSAGTLNIARQQFAPAMVSGVMRGVENRAPHPWTRVNNCTARHLEEVGGVPVWQVKKQAGRLMTWAEIVRQSVKGSFFEPKDEGNLHGRQDPGAHRLPHMRHPQGDADNSRQER